jgi:outer membrane protein OmpU
MNIKKVGLTALATSLVATSVSAGALTLSGNAMISYSDYSGNETATVTKDKLAHSKIGMDQQIAASGSGELDNGWTVSVTHYIESGGGGSDTSSISLGMGDLGTLTYGQDDAQGGVKSIDDLTPTAYEEAWDGPVGTDWAAMSSGNAFVYSNTYAGAAVSIMYSENLQGADNQDDGAVSSGTDGVSGGTSTSISVVYPVGDTGLTVYAGTGKEGQPTKKELDHDAIGIKYAFGPVTVGYQRNEQDDTAASGAVDLETTMIGVSFMVNDNLAISYGQNNTEKTGTSVDQELEAINVSYTMGGMTIAAYSAKGDNIGNVAATTSDKNEVRLSFAF